MNSFLHDFLHSFPISSLPLIRQVFFRPSFPFLFYSIFARPSINPRAFSDYNLTQTLVPFSIPSTFVKTSICSREYSNSTSVGLSSSPPPEDTNKGQPTKQQDFILVPDPPTNCCMSGCANCVWITYAKELASIYRDGGQAAEEVIRAIEDPSLKIFLNLELKEALQEADNH